MGTATYLCQVADFFPTVYTRAIDPNFFVGGIMEKKFPACAECDFPYAERLCIREHGKGHEACPTARHRDIIQKAKDEALGEELRHFVYQASVQEGSGYAGKDGPITHPAATRLEETAQFARRMGYTRLGIAFCMGLRSEAMTINRYFKTWGFEVVSAVCKVGRQPKSDLGITPEEQVSPRGPESMCNPTMQAMLMNEAGVDFNILVGLCVGHDSLFLKAAQAPCTVLIVKDRLLAHNPVAAIYQYGAYYRCLEQEAKAAVKASAK